jgi:biotin synthase
MQNEIQKLYHSSLINLVRKSSQIHDLNFHENTIQASALLSIKTGGCPENCSYCPQSAHHQTEIKKTKILNKEEVLLRANLAKQAGATRFCMGAAWREVKDGADFDHVLELVTTVSKMGLETCCTLGMLSKDQARRLKQAGLKFYNHNIDTSPEFYKKIIQTRTFEDRRDTLKSVRDAGLSICTGGILGMGEDDTDRIAFISELISMDPQPESITVNLLVPIHGTPLENQKPIDPFILVRVISILRIKAPRSMIRLSAGRTGLSDETQFLCFLAGANSIFLGDKLLTSPNPDIQMDSVLLDKCGLKLSGQKENDLTTSK